MRGHALTKPLPPMSDEISVRKRLFENTRRIILSILDARGNHAPYHLVMTGNMLDFPRAQFGGGYEQAGDLSASSYQQCEELLTLFDSGSSRRDFRLDLGVFCRGDSPDFEPSVHHNYVAVPWSSACHGRAPGRGSHCHEQQALGEGHPSRSGRCRMTIFPSVNTLRDEIGVSGRG